MNPNNFVQPNQQPQGFQPGQAAQAIQQNPMRPPQQSYNPLFQQIQAQYGQGGFSPNQGQQESSTQFGQYQPIPGQAPQPQAPQPQQNTPNVIPPKANPIKSQINAIKQNLR